MGVVGGRGKKAHVGESKSPDPLLPSAGWTRAAARCRGFYARYLVLCVNIKLNYNPAPSNVGRAPFNLFFLTHLPLRQFISQQRRCGRDTPETGSKCCIAFFFPRLFSFLQRQVERCAVHMVHNAANYSKLRSPCPQLCPLIPECYAPSLTAGCGKGPSGLSTRFSLRRTL